MIHKSTIDFLRKLSGNNNREWFGENRNLYENARYDFEVFVFGLIQKISEFDENVSELEPKNCIFRIYRDVRFSKNKSPYKTNFAASVNPGGKNAPTAGYYLHIDPKEYFLASGMYMPGPEKLFAVRSKIVSDFRRFIKIISRDDFKKYFRKLWDGNSLKTTPKGFDRDHPAAEYLRLKSFIVWHPVSEAKVLSKNFAEYASGVFKASKELNDFINEA